MTELRQETAPLTIEVGGLATRYVDRGAGDPVVVLHGWGAQLETVEPLIRWLAQGRRAIALDLPGFGSADPPPEAWDTRDYARFTLAFLARLGIERATFVGHSFGGRIAIRIAAESPEAAARLVLVDAAGIRPRRRARYYRRVALAKAMKLAARILGPPGRRLQQRVVGRLASSDYASAGALRPTFVRVVNEDLRPLLPAIAVPTLLVWGGLDEDTPVWQGRVMEELIPDAGLVVFDRAGHYSYLDEPVRFRRVVEHFLGATAGG